MKNLVMAIGLILASVAPSFAVKNVWILVVVPTATSTTQEFVCTVYDKEKDLDDAASLLADTQYRDKKTATYKKVTIDLDAALENFGYQLQKVAK